MLKIGQNWGKIANYPPKCSTKIGTTEWNYVIWSPKSSEDQKKKRFSPQFGTIFGRILRDLFVLTGPFSSDHPALKSRWEDAKSRSGDAKS